MLDSARISGGAL